MENPKKNPKRQNGTTQRSSINTSPGFSNHEKKKKSYLNQVENSLKTTSKRSQAPLNFSEQVRGSCIMYAHVYHLSYILSFFS